MEYNLNNTYIVADNIISSLGFTTQENIDAILDGQSGIRLTEDQSITDSPIWAATICNDRLEHFVKEHELESYSKVEQLIILSVKNLLSEKNIDLSSSECGMIISTTKGNVDLLKHCTEKLDPKVFLTNTASSIADYFNLADRISVLSNACISGVSALITASRLLEMNIYRHIVVVGVDVLSHFITSGFQSFKSLSEGICKPYDAHRDGLSLGEACGSVLLSKDYSDKSVILRGGTTSNDANHISGPSRTGDGLSLAILGAMKEAGISSQGVDFVNLHGTATVFNDEMEEKAMHLAQLQERPTNSLKSYFGHTLGASGVIETIACVHQLKREMVFGTFNYNEGGTSVPLNIKSEHMSLPSIKTCIKTASGFGGCNAAIVLSLVPQKIEINKETIATEEINKCIVDGGIISNSEGLIFSSDSHDFSVFIREAFKNLGETNQKFYKMDDLSKLGYVASAYLLKDVSFESSEIGIILSNRSSSLDTDIKFQTNIDAQGDKAASPAVFVYTLPNIVIGEICIRHKIQGENTFFVENNYQPHKLRKYAEQAMQKRNLRFFIYGWCEYLNDTYRAEFRLLERK